MEAPSPPERNHVRLGSRRVALPSSALLRVALGISLVLGGFLGFLPILGFWMLPLGLLILSIDIPAIRRLRRRMEVPLFRWWYRLRGTARR